MKRRRFLAIAAAFAASPAASATRWQGRALGADASITIHAPDSLARRALSEARKLLDESERLFSLFRPTSALARLNRSGRLSLDNPRFHVLLDECDRIYRLTKGSFDPTVQPLWHALATGADPAPARALVGWSRVRRRGDSIILGADQQITLNGIAQGYATDLVAEVFRNLGLDQCLVDIGELQALGGPWHIGLDDPVHGMVSTRQITDRAVATSSPAALSLGSQFHILGPNGEAPRWSTVSVEAASAALADGLSTALCLADPTTIRRVADAPGVHRIVLVAPNGDVSTVQRVDGYPPMQRSQATDRSPRHQRHASR